MTDMSIAELIAELRGFAAGSESARASLMRDAADRLEAADQERDNWKMSAEEAERAEKRAGKRADAAREEVGYEKRMREFISGERDRFIDLKRAADQRAVQAEAELRDAFRTDIPSLKDQRDALAAVVEKVRAWAGSHSGSVVSIIRSLLATAPADALRELKADVWDEGHHAGLRQADYEYGAAGFQVVKPNPYRREEQGRG